jgi:hypothetical protein
VTDDDDDDDQFKTNFAKWRIFGIHLPHFEHPYLTTLEYKLFRINNVSVAIDSM